MRIRTKFLTIFLSISFLPLILLANVDYNSARQVLIQDVQDKLQTIATLEIARIRAVVGDASLLAAVTSDYQGLGQTGEIIIGKYAPDGSIVYVTPRRFEKFANAPSLLMARTLKGEENFFPDAISYQGKHEVAVTRYLSDLGWGVVVKIDSDEAFQSVNTLRDMVIVFSFIFLLIIVIATLFFVHSITAPILNLAGIAREVAEGDLSKRALVVAKDEIGELATSFNEMIVALEESHQDLENKVKARTVELEASNKDLEAFSYSVSHDLRAPLRAIDGFSKILSEDYTGKLDDDGQHIIATIRESTKQMANLIDDLLAFSRFGRQEMKAVDFDMTALAKSVFEELRAVNLQRLIQFKCEDLPIAHADPILIRQVWVNLLSNAIKFTRKKDIAIITVGSILIDGELAYFVKDNGVGFDMKYVDKLFVVFQRLHSAQEFEGTGIGLSIAARIVKRHGGKIWGKGIVDQGAIFYFSLPNSKS